MTQAIWIDQEDLEVGQVGFLRKITNPLQGWTRYELNDRPPYTNVSREPCARGWCGAYNDTSTYGCGVWQVMRIAKNGRAKLAEVIDSERLADWLEEVGYPGLLAQIINKNGEAE